MEHEDLLRNKTIKGLSPHGVEFRKRYLKLVVNKLVLGDCLRVLPCLPDDCIDLIHTSPPYNIEKNYAEYADERPIDTYRDFLRAVIGECTRVLKPHGSIFWQTGYTTSAESPHDIIPIDLLSYELFKEFSNIHLRDRIIWNYFGGMSFQRKFKNRHETIMWYCKSDLSGSCEPHFDVDAVRERSRELDKRNNLLGRNPGNVWSVDRVAFGSVEQTSHIAVFPEDISEKIIRSCTLPGWLVLDPLSGSGTTCKVAKSLGRRWIGIEISRKYYEDATRRLGFQPEGEFETILSWILKEKVFRSEATILALDEVCERLSLFVRHIHLSEFSNLWEMAQIQLSSKDSDAYKDAKVAAWEMFDSFFKTATGDNSMGYINTLFERSFKNTRNYNGYRKFQICLDCLQRLIKEFSRPGSTSRAMIQRIFQEEVSSFKEMPNERYKLIALEKRIKSDSGLTSKRTRTVAREQTKLAFITQQR